MVLAGLGIKVALEVLYHRLELLTFVDVFRLRFKFLLVSELLEG